MVPFVKSPKLLWVTNLCLKITGAVAWRTKVSEDWFDKQKKALIKELSRLWYILWEISALRYAFRNFKIQPENLGVSRGMLCFKWKESFWVG